MMTAPTRALLFPGQGSQIPGMGRTAVARSGAAAQFFDDASAVIGRDLRALCWSTSKSELAATENVQPALTAASVAHWISFRELTPGRPAHDRFAGHSVGAIAAAVVGGYLTPTDGVRLAAARGALMARAPLGGKMLAVAHPKYMSHEQLTHAERIAEQFDVDLAAINSPTQLVFAGSAENIGRLASSVPGRCTFLNVSNGFHSRYMEPVLSEWAEILALTNFMPGSGFIGCAHPVSAHTSADVRIDLQDGLTRPVRWRAVLAQLTECERLLVFGPGSTLVRLARPILRGRPIEMYGEAA